MNKINEFSKHCTDMVMNFAPSPESLGDAFRKSAEFGEKMSTIALKAAQGSVEIANKWTAETLEQIGEVTKTKDEAADYAKAASEFATRSVGSATGHLTGMAELAKDAQIETTEAILSAGK